MAKKNKKQRQQKTRINFQQGQKKRAVRSRQDWKRAAQSDELEELGRSERVSGKGAASRRRTIKTVSDADQVILDVDEAECLTGLVVQAVGSLNCRVLAEDGHTYICTVRKLLRSLQREQRSAIVAGDRVLLQPIENGQPGQQLEEDAQSHSNRKPMLREGVVVRIEPRQSTLSRQAKGKEHVIVANIDQVIIVASAADPPLKPNLIDRFLISAEKGGSEPIICVNKSDLANENEVKPVMNLYRSLGYEVISTVATARHGLDRLHQKLQNKISVFAGQSGVGKSSLLNALLPQLELKTASIGEGSGKGRHTTRTARLLPLSNFSKEVAADKIQLRDADKLGGWVVDTPGIRSFGLWAVAPTEVEAYFVEFQPHLPHCRFPDCTHTHEEGCRVKVALEAGGISRLRYESYCRLFAGDDGTTRLKSDTANWGEETPGFWLPEELPTDEELQE